MADLAITNTFVANTLAKASEVNTNFTDVKNYVNARNQGTTGWDQITLATSGLLKLPTGGTAAAPSLTFTGDVDNGLFYVAADTFGLSTGGTERVRLSTTSLQSALALTLTPTSNQLILGTTNTTTLSATAPAASRTYTFPDVLNNANIILSEGTQTINGTKTFGSAPSVPSLNATNTTNQLILGTTNTYTLNATAPAASRVITLADPGASASLVVTEGTQTINGAKTFGSNTTHSGTILNSDGTSALPAYSFSADTDSGVYRIGTNNIALGTNATRAIEITSSQAVKIKGTATNDSATAGDVGEYTSAANASGTNFPATTTYGDAASLSLTAGDWDVTLIVFADRNTATWSRWDAGISTTTGNSTTGLLLGDNWIVKIFASSATTPVQDGSTVASYRTSLSATTTYYAKIGATFTAGTPQYYYRFSARRAR